MRPFFYTVVVVETGYDNLYSTSTPITITLTLTLTSHPQNESDSFV